MIENVFINKSEDRYDKAQYDAIPSRDENNHPYNTNHEPAKNSATQTLRSMDGMKNKEENEYKRRRRKELNYPG